MLLLLAVAGTGGCAAKEAEFTGFVTAIDRGSAAGTARVTVESHAHKMVARHVLIVTARTALMRRENGIDKPVALDALAVKSWVKVWFDGAADAPEAYARRIVIVDRAELDTDGERGS